jgi:erythromycin esterase-like protein
MRFHGANAKAIVWEHNTHIGDARATDMRDEGMVNVGQLVQEEHADHGVVRVGFGSFEGSVIAGRHWGDRMRRMAVPPAPEGTWEHMLHQAGPGDKLLLTERLNSNAFFDHAIGHRAIGVVYDPERESWGNYVPSVLPKRYEAFLFFDTTKALHPLHITPDGGQMPETYPWGV